MPASRVKSARAEKPTREPSASESSGESDGESSNHSQSPAERVEVEENGSRKRRRLSPAGSDSEPEDVPSRPVVMPTSTVSRIKAKQPGLSKLDDGLPAVIKESIKGHENTTFGSLDVDPWLVGSLANMAIKNPTGIQRGCIPEILKGRDCIGGSRTGSGKTVAFAVPILQKWAQDPVGIFAVVLTPTRCVICTYVFPMRHTLIW